MTSALRKPDIWTETAYLSEENVAFQRHEFVGGHVYAMAGASEGHSDIKINLVAWLKGKLPADCRVFDGDLKLRIEAHSVTRYYYPDLFVSCGPRDRNQHFRTDAILVIEILSMTTRRLDRGEKFDGYKEVPSLQEYVLISRDEARVEVFRRESAWKQEVYEMPDVIELGSVGHRLPVHVVYDDISF